MKRQWIYLIALCCACIPITGLTQSLQRIGGIVGGGKEVLTKQRNEALQAERLLRYQAEDREYEIQKRELELRILRQKTDKTELDLQQGRMLQAELEKLEAENAAAPLLKNADQISAPKTQKTKQSDRRPDSESLYSPQIQHSTPVVVRPALPDRPRVHYSVKFTQREWNEHHRNSRDAYRRQESIENEVESGRLSNDEAHMMWLRDHELYSGRPPEHYEGLTSEQRMMNSPHFLPHSLPHGGNFQDSFIIKPDKY